MIYFKKRFLGIVGLLCFFVAAQAQVNGVEFGKNRIQYKKFKWKFYQSNNFNVYVHQGGTELGNFVSQLAEKELPDLESFVEYSQQRKVNIFVYNSYDEYKQSNIGLNQDWQNTGGITKLPNNKMVVYFTGDHNHLRLQIRQGIAKTLLDNLLFGSDLGEVASNQALLDLPKWLTDGYIAYVAENWSAAKDDELRSAMLNGEYKTFYDFAFKTPLLAGHSFWQYFAQKYRQENVTYFLYLARVYKSLNRASNKICKKDFKQVLAEFMVEEQDKYFEDLRRRRNQPKGNLVVYEDVTKNDFVRFQVNPNARNNNYVVVEFSKGKYAVKYYENYEAKLLYSTGVRTNEGDINPNLPILAWDGKGQRILCIYPEKGKIKMFVYDIVNRYKRSKQEITDLDQVIDANFMLDANTLVMSAVKNGHTDIYTYNIEQNKLTQITNDVYDDLNPVMVSFPARTGIIFSSNRPSPDALSNENVLPTSRYNIFLVDILNTKNNKQITQLTNAKYGNATKPMQYNTNHFTFVSDESGIANRWAGFFATQRTGLDTLYYIGEELLRNPTPNDLDSTLLAWRKPEPDSISYFQVYKDSTYTFPITNYESSLLDSRISGFNGQVTETRREGNEKYVYKLKVNEDALKKRNVNARITPYMKDVIKADRAVKGGAIMYAPANKDSAKASGDNVFQSAFADEAKDSSSKPYSPSFTVVEPPKPKAKLFNTGLKFAIDNVQVGFSNTVLINRFQPYNNGNGPVQLNNGNDFNAAIRVGTMDLMEDIRITAAIRPTTSLTDKDIFIVFQNYRRRFDWGFTYYRSNISNQYQVGAFTSGGTLVGAYNTKLFTNLYQANFSYAINETKRFSYIGAIRQDKYVVKPTNVLTGAPDVIGLNGRNFYEYNVMGRLEYVHDNTVTPAMNIWNGLRWKAYMDIIVPYEDKKTKMEEMTLNFGFDARHYLPIYRNCIWAVRGAADFSWGNRKIVYYLGGVDGWIGPRFNGGNTPSQDVNYTFESLALNMRGFNQNIANGNNALVINSEVRLPIFSTFFNRPINNSFLRNLQLVQFIDLGTAWTGNIGALKRPTQFITSQNPNNNPITVRLDAGGIGPFAGGYGFGVRSVALGYFLKFDVAWQMNGLFKGQPLTYLAMGLDF
jgi:hypothetical protein